MASFQARFSAYVEVASLAILVWDILNNLTNDYRLLFRRRLGIPTMAYFVSRLSALSWAIITVVFSNTPSIDCTTFGTTSVALIVVVMTSTMFLCYLRVCAVWRWNHYIVGLYGVSWLSVIASSLTMIHSIKRLQVETCTVIIVRERLLLAPFIVAVINHTLVFMAITYGICKNTLRGDLTSKHGIMVMLGKSLPTFSKALLHDSQISYIIILGITLITLIWIISWPQVTTAFRLAPVAPNLVLLTILNGRVHRNTKLGLYNMVSLQSNDRKSQPHTAAYNKLSGKSIPAGEPIPIAVTNADGDRSDYSTTRSRGSVNSLDFGMV